MSVCECICLILCVCVCVFHSTAVPPASAGMQWNCPCPFQTTHRLLRHLFALMFVSARVPALKCWGQRERWEQESFASGRVSLCCLLEAVSVRKLPGRSPQCGNTERRLALAHVSLHGALDCRLVNKAFPGGPDSQESICSSRDPDLIPGLGRSPGEGNDYPLQNSRLENPMDRGAWRATWGGKGSHRKILPCTFSYSFDILLTI